MVQGTKAEGHARGIRRMQRRGQKSPAPLRAQDEGSFGAIVNNVIEQVLMHRASLMEGLKVMITVHYPAGNADMPPSRAILNRVLRHMSRTVPGCTWTLH